MNCRIAIVSLGLLFSGISAQQYKFPQNVKYPYGFMPSTFSSTNFQNWYTKYKSQSSLLPKCNNGIAVGTDNGAKVEAMGWAMIIAAYMGDKETFDGLYTYYKSKIQSSHGMMAWLTSCSGVSDAGSASDGDLDVAFSLLVAYWQWGESYKEEATKTITTVKKLITNCSGTSVVVGGYSGKSPYGGCSKTDISYYTPAFFREFAKFTNDTAWSKLADDTYTVLNNGADDNTGLVPDWQTLSGGAVSGSVHTYGFDACRVPWRMALDYLWNGNEKAKTWCTTISTWANKIGPKNIKDGYNLNGSAIGNWHNMSYTGGFAVAAMCNSQEISDAFGKEIASMSFDSYWYHAFLGNCYMLAMSGNMWRPGLSSDKPGVIRGHGTFESALPIAIKKVTGRELVVSGIGERYRVTIATLSGKSINQAVSTNGGTAIVDMSKWKSGCYILIVSNKEARVIDSRVVSVY
jgi:endo-1,4-beta-D-glucanase Y